MSEQRAKGCLVATFVWCVILALLAVGYKFLVHPYLSDKLKDKTGSSSQYRSEIVVAADSFSGYCILRSDAVKQALKESRIKLTVQDDKADYDKRLEDLRSGKVQFAAFTIDSLLKAGAKAGDFPGTIVLVLDETKGGDAIVAYQGAVGSLQDLNQPGARIVLTANSPSEFLARVVLANFNLSGSAEKLFAPADGAGAVFKQLRSAGPTEKKAFVLWEPYVSRALQQKGVHVLLDSSRLKGYIVDVLVVQRQFLNEHAEVVRALVEAYARAAYRYNQEPDGLVKLVLADAKQTGAESLDDAQARKIVEGIQWKNLLENYAHFGLSAGAEQGGLASLEDMIGNITDVLVRTRGIASDPLAGKYHTLFYDTILKELRVAKFHPGKAIAGLPSLGTEGPAETIRPGRELQALKPEEWGRLVPVGELRTVPIEFRRASAEISIDSERDLQNLSRRLQTFPQFYLRVIGHARAEGDPEANRALAQARADAAAQYLIGQGLPPQRIKTETALPTAGGAEAQAVSFFVGQLPF